LAEMPEKRGVYSAIARYPNAIIELTGFPYGS
jgi:hypothetical protein